MTALRERLERGHGMRAQRLGEGLLLIAAFMLADPRPAYLAFAMLALQVLSPTSSPIALAWSALVRRLPADRLGNLYFDENAIRGASAISCMVLLLAWALVRTTHLGRLGWLLVGMPAASCILSATVGFCAGCGYYVLGRDLLARTGLIQRTPEGTCDVDIDGR